MSRRLGEPHPPSPSDDDGASVAEVIWGSDAMRSLEHCAVRRRGDGWMIVCATVLPIDGSPGHLTARVGTDHEWNTEDVRVEIHRSQTRHLSIVVRSDEWHVDGTRRRDLDGCRDVDLGWTPATNLLPLRRLGLEVGDEATIDAAWLRFPEFDLQRTEQTYTRLSALAWRYRSGTADHVLQVDEFGLVTRYGDDLWTTVTTAG